MVSLPQRSLQRSPILYFWINWLMNLCPFSKKCWPDDVVFVYFSNNDNGTWPRRRHGRRKHKRRRSPSSSSTSSSEVTPRKTRKLSSRLSTTDVMKLLKNWREESSKPRLSNNNLNNVIPEFDPSNKTQTDKKVNEFTNEPFTNGMKNKLFTFLYKN